MVFLFAAFTFVASFLTASIAVAIGWIWLQRRTSGAAASGSASANLLSASPLLRNESLSTISAFDSLLTRFELMAKLQTLVAEAGMQWSVGRVMALMLLLATTAGVLAGSIEWIPGWAGLLFTALAGASPSLYLRRRRAARIRLFSEQFPEALDSMASSLRAGHPVVATFYVVGQEFPDPLGPEWRRTFDECKLGQPLSEALDNLAHRIPVIELSMLSAAIQLQSRTGGNLGEVLARLGEAVRESAALRGEIRAIASHGKLTGTILTVLPLAIVAVMLYMNPAHFDVLLQHPSGKHLIAAAIGCLVLAHFVISRIVDIRL